MSPVLPEYCVIVPEGRGYKMHELRESAGYTANSFVVIPYCNPEKENPVPRFFEIVETRSIDIPLSDVPVQKTKLVSKTPKARYLQTVRELLAEIQQGNIYEINYCMEFYRESVKTNPLEVFVKLDKFAGAPYTALVKLGDEHIISASPELFLRKQGGDLYTKPIKGTAKRDADPERDKELKENLFNSLKERTENVMAVDVARNDLSQVATRGSVHVNKLYNIESYENVHQMVSTVSCKLQPAAGFEDIIKATFPMASMTGAPKISAMDLTDRREDFNRGFYSGAMGFIDNKGDFELWVVIRSVFYNSGTKRLSIAVGGAITYLSEPLTEYRECLLKAKNMMSALNAELDEDPEL